MDFRKDIADIKSVGEILKYMKDNENLDIIDFTCKLNEIGKLSTHDDGECTFCLYDKKLIQNIVTGVFGVDSAGIVMGHIGENMGKYVLFPDSSCPNIYSTFDDYIKSGLK